MEGIDPLKRNRPEAGAAATGRERRNIFTVAPEVTVYYFARLPTHGGAMNRHTHYTQTLTKGKGNLKKGLQPKVRGRGEGITYCNVCQYCNETRNLITVRRAGGDLFVCRKHAAGGVL